MEQNLGFIDQKQIIKMCLLRDPFNHTVSDRCQNPEIYEQEVNISLLRQLRPV